MSSGVQVGYYIFAGCCAAISVVFLWRRDRRETHTNSFDMQGKLQSLQTNKRSEMTTTLYDRLISIRIMYIHLNDEARLRAELDLTLSDPSVMGSLEQLHYQIFEFESQIRRTRLIRYIRQISVLFAFLSFIGILLPLIGYFWDNPVEYHPMIWITLIIFVESVISIFATSLYGSILHRKIDSRPYDRSER